MKNLIAIASLAVLIYLIRPMVRGEIAKFLAWRERVRKWKTRNTVPPSEYRRDNRLWTIRLAGLVASLSAIGGLGVLLFVVKQPPLNGWSEIAMAVIALAGAAIWNVLSDHVR
jgi:hypothetical protein